MKTEKIIKHLENLYPNEQKLIFEAIINAKLPPTNYSLGQANALNKFKEIIINNLKRY